MHNVGLDQINHVTARLIRFIVIDCHIGVILVPAPVFFPCQRIAEQTAVCHGCKSRMKIHKIGIFPVHAAHIPRRSRFRRYLAVFDRIGDFIGYDFPAKLVIQRNGIRIQQCKRLALMPHIGQALYHEFFHNAVSRILRIGADTCYKSDLKNRVVNIHFERINRKLRNECLSVKTAQHVRTV